MSKLTSISLLRRLIHGKNMQKMRRISQLSVKHKRRVFASIRKLNPKHGNYLFTENLGCTIGEFCIAQVLLSDGKRKIKEHLDKMVDTW